MNCHNYLCSAEIKNCPENGTKLPLSANLSLSLSLEAWRWCLCSMLHRQSDLFDLRVAFWKMIILPSAWHLMACRIIGTYARWIFTVGSFKGHIKSPQDMPDLRLTCLQEVFSLRRRPQIIGHTVWGTHHRFHPVFWSNVGTKRNTDKDCSWYWKPNMALFWNCRFVFIKQHPNM